MTEILDYLFLGSVDDSKNKKFIENKKISHVIVAGGKLRNIFPELIIYKKLKIKDDPSTLILAQFVETFEYIENIMKEDKDNRILIHCIGGISRSPTLVIGYIMFKQCLLFEDAFKFVKNKHKKASPNPGFLNQLKSFEICLFDKKYQIDELEDEKNNFEEKKYNKNEKKNDEINFKNLKIKINMMIIENYKN